VIPTVAAAAAVSWVTFSGFGANWEAGSTVYSAKAPNFVARE
jgi:hypothetical protein